jgi:hypothetical protein
MLEKAWSVAAATEDDTSQLAVAIAAVNARVLHKKLGTREVLAAGFEPEFAAYCRMLAETLPPLPALLDNCSSVETARDVLAAVRVQVEALAAMAAGTANGAPAVFDELLDQLEATDLFLVTFMIAD